MRAAHGMALTRLPARCVDRLQKTKALLERSRHAQQEASAADAMKRIWCAEAGARFTLLRACV
jgi:hypothetical protein